MIYTTAKIAVLLLLVGQVSAFRLLYPEHPLDRKAADEPFQPEYLLAKEKRIPCSLFDFDSFVDSGKFRPHPAFQPEEKVLYRGWMMTPAKYQKLVARMEKMGAQPISSVADYTRCHHLPGWYDACADLTAETHFLEPEEDAVAAALELGWDRFFVKDFVKSNTGNKGSIAESPTEILEIVNQLKFYRGDIEGGLALRKVEEYIPDSEQRYFVVHQNCYAPDGNVPTIVQKVAETIQAPFYSVDIIQTVQGVWRVVELGDGQVSDKKQWPLEKFVDVLSAIASEDA